MPEPVGNEEDERAFREWANLWIRDHLRYMGSYGPGVERYRKLTSNLRYAFDAGMERGMDKRGCLHPNCGECNGGEDALRPA